MQTRNELIVEPVGLDAETLPRPLDWETLFGNDHAVRHPALRAVAKKGRTAHLTSNRTCRFATPDPPTPDPRPPPFDN